MGIGKMNVLILGSDSSHVEAYTEIIHLDRSGKHEVKWIFSRNHSEASDKAAHLGIPRVLHTVREEPAIADLVLILERYGLNHLEAAKPALQQGACVYVDKPFADSFQDALTMVAIAKSTDASLVSFSPYRFSREVQDLKQMVQPQKIESIEITGPADTSLLGTPESKKLHFYAVHTVDVLLALCGSGYKQLKAFESGTNIEVKLAGPGKPDAFLTLVKEQTETYQGKITTIAGEVIPFSIDPYGDFYLRVWDWLKAYSSDRRTPGASLAEALEGISILDGIEDSITRNGYSVVLKEKSDI